MYFLSFLVIWCGSKSGLLTHLGQNRKLQMFTFWCCKFKVFTTDPSRDVDPMILWVKGFMGSQHVQSIVPVFLELIENILAADR